MLTRDRNLLSRVSALIVVDVQNGTFHPGLAVTRPEFFAAARDLVIPNIARAIAHCRAHGVEVIFTVIENLTRDGRDRGLEGHRGSS